MLKAIENAERERKCLKAIGRLAVDGAALVAGHPARLTRHASSGELQRRCAGPLNLSPHLFLRANLQ